MDYDTSLRASPERVAQYFCDFRVIEGNGSALVPIDE